jgi:hypothetical protein
MDPALKILLTDMKQDMRDMDQKIDQLLEEKNRRKGSAIVVHLIWGAMIQAAVALIGIKWQK